ncbi:hypothetical protein BGW41_006675, partial [Actinomortierella wolfii]
MGLTDILPLIKELQFEGALADPKDYAEVHVDMQGCYFGFLASRDFSITRTLLKEQLSVEELQARRIERLAAALDKQLSTTFERSTAILHFDGSATEEKQHAQAHRATTFQQQIDRLKARIIDVEAKCALVIRSPQARLVKSWTTSLRKLFRKAMLAWRKTCRLDEFSRQHLAKKLATRGLRICGRSPETGICRGETDLCVAQMAAQAQINGRDPTVVASGDSDYLAYDNVTLLRQNPKRRSEYREYTQQEVLAVLNKNRPFLTRRKKNQ